jgi:hypothetical protein
VRFLVALIFAGGSLLTHVHLRRNGYDSNICILLRLMER